MVATAIDRSHNCCCHTSCVDVPNFQLWFCLIQNAFLLQITSLLSNHIASFGCFFVVLLTLLCACCAVILTSWYEALWCVACCLIVMYCSSHIVMSYRLFHDFSWSVFLYISLVIKKWTYNNLYPLVIYPTSLTTCSFSKAQWLFFSVESWYMLNLMNWCSELVL